MHHSQHCKCDNSRLPQLQHFLLTAVSAMAFVPIWFPTKWPCCRNNGFTAVRRLLHHVVLQYCRAFMTRGITSQPKTQKAKASKQIDHLCLFADQFNMVFPRQQLVNHDAWVFTRWYLFDFLIVDENDKLWSKYNLFSWAFLKSGLLFCWLCWS